MLNKINLIIYFYIFLFLYIFIKKKTIGSTKYYKKKKLINWWEIWSFYNVGNNTNYENRNNYIKYELSIWLNWHILENRIFLLFLIIINLI